MSKKQLRGKKNINSPSTVDENESDNSKTGSVPASPSMPSSVSPMTSPAANLTPTSVSGGSTSTTHRPSPVAWFTTEIQSMMHGFGDCPRPLVESALLIEEIIHSQLTSLLHQAADVANLRSARYIGMQDFLFLMRKDKSKLRRLIRYICMKDFKSSTFGGMCQLDDEDSPTQGFSDYNQPYKKKSKLCYDFLASIDQTGELLSVFDDEAIDEVKHERNMRAEMMSRDMNWQQYIEFSEARRASFAPRLRNQKFREWLLSGANVEPKPNAVAVELFSYLAYETVAQIMDFVLLVRQDQNSDVSDAIHNVMPPLCVNRDMVDDLDMPVQSSSVSSFSLQGSSSVAASPNAKSPAMSPPSTPKASSPITPNSSSLLNNSLHNTSGGSTNLRSKTKKHKRSGSFPNRDQITGQAIDPSLIREALRRYGQSIGPFSEFMKKSSYYCKDRLFCT